MSVPCHEYYVQFYRKMVTVLKSVNVSDVAGVNLKLQCLNDVTDFDDDLSDKAKVWRGNHISTISHTRTYADIRTYTHKHTYTHILTV